MVILSVIIILITLPLSLVFCVKVSRGWREVGRWSESWLFQIVQEYERAVIFRLGRLWGGGERYGPGSVKALAMEGPSVQAQLRKDAAAEQQTVQLS